MLLSFRKGTFPKDLSCADRAGVNCCKFRIILDIFGEFGLTETDVTTDRVKLIPVKGKVDLEKSRVITNLKQGR